MPSSVVSRGRWFKDLLGEKEAAFTNILRDVLAPLKRPDGDHRPRGLVGPIQTRPVITVGPRGDERARDDCGRRKPAQRNTAQMANRAPPSRREDHRLSVSWHRRLACVLEP